MADVTMRQMLEAGVHFGHQTRYWNPKMAPLRAKRFARMRRAVKCRLSASAGSVAC
jgi:ribosomal protein S2